MVYDEELRPAFAGYLVDGAIGAKEIVATIVDLMVRGYIDAPRAGRVWEKSRLDILIKTDKRDLELLPYERYTLEELFKESNEISVSEVKSLFNEEKALKMMNEELLKQDIDYKEIYKTYRLKSGNTTLDIDPHPPGSNGRTVNATLSTDNPLIYLMPILAIAAFALMPLSGGGTEAIVLIGIILALTGLWLMKTKKVPKNSEQERLRKKYQDLQSMLRSMPLENGRLFNEYLPYAIAFGLDKYWNEKFELS